MILCMMLIEGEEERSKLEQIYDAYRSVMYRRAYEILRNSEDAEDAVQTAFVRIAENLEKISEPVCPKTKGFVITIAEHQAIDLYRRKKRRPEVEWEEELVEAPSAEYAGENALTGCILRLPGRYREAILLRYAYGYTTREIAEILGISEEASRKLVQRARTRLEMICAEEGIL